MTSILRMEALSGVRDEGPPCYLLQVDEFHFLLDCGWDEQFDPGYADALRKRAPIIDAVLLSYGDIPHAGALPFLVGKCGLTCPIYATVPVYKMGQMFLYDWYLSHNDVEEFSLFSLDDVDAAFEHIQKLKYSQQVSLKGRGHGLQITPLPAGHMIGGTVWRITKMGEEEIVYAVDFNHKKERHLNGCTFEGVTRPNLLIFDAFNAMYTQARRKQRDEQLLTNILQTLRQGGDVLLVGDTAGRVLELAHLLDQLWHNADAGLITYSLVLMNRVAYNVVEFAKSQVEWMSDKILRVFEEGRYNPFHFRHVQLAHTLTELHQVRSPKVVLASEPDMEVGFSRELFLEWCADSRNSIILTGRGGPRTLSSKLIHMAQGGKSVSRHVTLEVKRRIRLEGKELDDFWKVKRDREEKEARARLEVQKRNTRVETLEDSDDSDIEQVDTTVADHPYDIMWKWEQQQKASFFKQTKRSFPMYPCIEEKVKWDDYGIVIKPEDYMIAEPLITTTVGRELQTGRRLTEDDDSSASEIPTKCISSVTKLEVMCHVAFIDFEGRSDGESLKKLLAQIRPKQLVIVHGSTEATRHLKQFAEESKIERIFTPSLGEVIDATIESHIFQVTLTDALMSSLELQPVKDAELAWVDARITASRQGGAQANTMHISTVLPSNIDNTASVADERSSRIAQDTDVDLYGESIERTEAGTDQPMQTDSSLQNGHDQNGALGAENEGLEEATSEITPCLESLPALCIPPHTAVFVNDPKLSDLKQILMQNGLQAEFSSGVLYVNNVLSIRRNEAGRFHIEGCVCDDYYRIRDLVYRQYAIV